MVRSGNGNWMADRLRFSAPRRFLPVRRTQILQLPDDVLLRVLRALMNDGHRQNANNVRDFWNVAVSCKRLYGLAVQMMHALHPHKLVLDGDSPHGVSRAMPDDVAQGLLLAMRVGGSRLRALRLGAMQWPHQNAILQHVARQSLVTELSFEDAEDGTMVPGCLARRLKCVSITSPRKRTLRRLQESGCTPHTVQLFRVDDFSDSIFYSGWGRLMHSCSRADVTWTRGSGQDLPHGPHLFSAEQGERMYFWSRRDGMPFGEKHALSMRAPGARCADDTIFGARTMWVNEWLQRRACSAEWAPLAPRWVEPSEGHGALTVIIEGASAAKELMFANGTLLHQFVDEVLCGQHGTTQIDTLLAMAPSTSNPQDARAVARVAACITKAVKNVRVLAMSAAVFAELKDIPLPGSLRSIGVVDRFATIALVRAIPSSLAALARTAGTERSVWVQNMRLIDFSDVRRRETLLRHAEAACRRVEATGLCAMGIRGALERWLRETLRASSARVNWHNEDEL